MNTSEVRKKYLKFFEKRGHSIIPSASLRPENDPTTLFVGSGMQPILPYLLGEKHPKGIRLVNSQKSFRAEDIEEVGDSRHTTFFEMLGNWSLGDYFKEEQLPWIFEFLTKEIDLDPEKLYATVFIGDDKLSIPKDTESVEIWKRLFEEEGIEAKDVEIGSEEDGYKKGMQGGRIFYYDAKKNWWSRSGTPENMPEGEIGGPDSEIFYEFTDIKHDKEFGEHCHPNCDCGRFMEIGNSVFMEYIKKEDGSFGQLSQKNVDFGGGLERITAASNDNPDVFEIDIFECLFNRIESEYSISYANEDKKVILRILADHLRAAIFLIADGVIPSNTDQGYVLRRLLRRTIRYADSLGIQKIASLTSHIECQYLDGYANYFTGSKPVYEPVEIIAEEEHLFRQTLKRGLKELEKGLPKLDKFKDGDHIPKHTVISGKVLFDMFTTYGFPTELSLEVFDNLRIKEGMEPLDSKIKTRITEEYKELMKKHQELSRKGSENKFKGGLVDHKEMSIKYHTATHLLHQALRNVLGDSVKQKGSNITPDRMRFDFSYERKMTEEEKQKVEDIVNEQIKKGLTVTNKELPTKEAKELGAIGLFESKYGDIVKVYKIGDFSLEICGGPHVTNTSQLGVFKITKEKSISSGVRRIRAILE